MEDVTYGIFTTEDFDKGYWGQMRRVALDLNRQVMGIHHPDDTNKWENGTDVDWKAYEDNLWNCMVQMPVFYYRAQRENYESMDTYRAAISTEPKNGFKHYPAWEREDGVIENFQYMSAFEGWVDGEGRLRSLPNKPVTASKTIAAFRNHALMNGNWFSQQDFYLTSAVQMLMIIELGGFNAQERLANGNIQSSYQETGRSLSLGNKSGGDDTFMSYRGIENFYMNYLKFVDGINLNNRQVYLAKKDFESDKFDGNYINQKLSIPTSIGYISDFHFTEENDFSFIPSSSNGGSASSHLADYVYEATGERIVRCGGYRSNVSHGGPFCFRGSSAASEAYTDGASRLQCLKS